MKKKIILIICAVVMAAGLIGCEQKEVETVSETQEAEYSETIHTRSMFVEIEQTSTWMVVYHRDTKVMYTVSTSTYNYGNFTLLVNPDGTPMIWEG